MVRSDSTMEKKKAPARQSSSSSVYSLFLSVILLLLIFMTLLNHVTIQRNHPSHYQQQHESNNNLAGFKSSSSSKRSSSTARLSNHPPYIPNDDGSRYHVVFSTDCSPFQHWQSYVLFYHAYKVGQPGNITRIASGCKNDHEINKTVAWHELHVKRRMSDRFHIHITPDFVYRGKDNDKNYKFANKPRGLLHWLEHADVIRSVVDERSGERIIDDDAIVILIDPDNIILRPLTRDFSNTTENIHVGHPKTRPRYHRVDHGSPIAQKFYGLSSTWTTFNLTRIVGPDSPSLNVTHADAVRYYPAGPPYLATARDMHLIAATWARIVGDVHEEYPHLYAEMFAYCIAAAHHSLRHELWESLAISEPTLNDVEYWPFVDAVPPEEACRFAFAPHRADGTPRYRLPNVFHYCQRYMVGPWFFGKRRLPTNFLTCESPLLKEPPMDIAVAYDYRMPPPPHKPVGEKKPMTAKRANRETFSLCTMISKMNEAAEFFKEEFCAGWDGQEGNMNKSMDLWKV